MRTKMKWTAALAATLAVLWAGAAQAQGARSSDSLTVTITPNAYYAVDIDTTGVVLDLGVVDMGTSTQTVQPAVMTTTSTYAATDMRISAVMSGGWTLETANTAALVQDKLAAWAVFTATSIVAAPVQGVNGAFSGTAAGITGSDVLGTASYDVGTASGGELLYVLTAGAAGYKSMEDLPSNRVDNPASRANLWLYFTLPPASTDLTPKTVTVTVNAGAPN